MHVQNHFSGLVEMMSCFMCTLVLIGISPNCDRVA